MANLTTTYLGLNLKNPLVAGSSGLTNSVEKIVEMEKNGVGAVVLKSLFEEQINNEVNVLLSKDLQNTAYPEAEDYIRTYLHDNTLHHYIELVKAAKEATSIPIIASINCVSGNEWMGFAREIEKAGADALEVNAFIVPTDRKIKSEEIEERYLEILTEVKKVVNIPVAMKIGPQFSNLVSMVDRLYAHGAAGVVMFNRFYEPDINLDKLAISAAEVFSSPADIRQSLRWVGIISGTLKRIDIAASTGIHDGEGLVKQLLAGATVGQVCSAMYVNGIPVVKEMVDYLEKFMKKWNFKSLDEFRGRLSYSNLPNPVLYERAQFMKYFSNNVNE
ncbi:dihydroorotate dehydrogenase-like protein [Prolixibacter denitrificans]|uniref:Diguanylate cyclase n=1 Tax=Prolixibacter denitrificans TaxID=1541063 RepID=A0A2P8CG66_9BACT|nr:dihydroorotate dehydrogenase-like protein [Prolixibacter denitrificans]PSK83912.1 dihydroorotate dehydrogenase (fumarate) [Prolixibacter denitrificans]GET23453.1 diguanylate cyclase [Prolixibacter denitrificans]